jgi:hypothetical protein
MKKKKENLEQPVGDRQSSAERITHLFGKSELGVGNFVRGEVYNPASSPLEIVGNDGKRILVLGPYESKELTTKDMTNLIKSTHFLGLQERNLVRLL